MIGCQGRAAEILLVEDNPADIRMTVEALREGRIVNHLSIARNGIEAMAFLRREGEHRQAPLPNLILLDLNLPRKDGREVLEEIKSDPALRRIPVVILTASEADEDVLASYAMHANCYITKPVDSEKFIRVIRSLEDFWLHIVQLPLK